MVSKTLRRIVTFSLVAYRLAYAAGGVMTGTGTSADPFLVADYSDLKAVGVGTTYTLSSAYRLITDIDASPSAAEDSSRGFKPIGAYKMPFTGIFQGGGHVIRNIKIKRGTQCIGLFGFVRNSEISNLGLSGVTIIGGEYTGALSGMSVHSTMTDCFATGSTMGINSSGRVGGLVGEIDSQSTVIRCYTEGSVQAIGYFSGGLVGNCDNSSAITDCHTTATVRGTGCGGGLVGAMFRGCRVTGCHATGSVTDTGSYTGGLIGSVNDHSTVSDCYATGTVIGGQGSTYGGSICGGLIGELTDTSTVIRCYATGSPTAKSYSVGGLIGSTNDSCKVVNCFATGSITSASFQIGGLIGDNRDMGTVIDCHATGSVSVKSMNGANSVGGLIGISEYGGTVTDCFATGNILDASTNSGYVGTGVGGLIGNNFYSSTVSRCYATGSVSGNTHEAGGLVGSSDHQSRVSESYATGQVSNTGWDAGGFVGLNGDTSIVSGCFTAGSVSGAGYLYTFGAIVGESKISSSVRGCYWDKETAIFKEVKYNWDTAVATSRMKQQSNYAGWNFDTSWRLRADSTYPGLRTLDNAPFAFIDTIESQRTLQLSALLANDCDIETGRSRLTLKVLALSRGTTDSVSTFSFPSGALYGDTASIRYRVGEIRTNDTLWGNITTAFITFDNISSVVTPTLVSPGNGIINQPLQLPLVWTRVAAATSYHVKVALDSNFKSISFEDSSLTDTTWSLSGLPNYTTYYWRVRSKDAAGVSAWTTCWRFRTIPLVPPTPVLLLPEDGAVGQTLYPALRWKRSLAAEKYYVQVASDTGFAGLIKDTVVTDTNFYPRGLAYLSTYYWRVRAQNVSGISGWSGCWSFSTNMPTPTLVSPGDTVKKQPLSLLFIWNKVSTAISYHIQVSLSYDFDKYSTAQIVSQDSTLSDSLKLITGLATGKLYYWRVRGKNASGLVSQWSRYQQFYTIATPQAPVLVFPWKGITEMPVSLPLVWNKTNNTFWYDVRSYHVQVASDTLFSSLFMQDSSLLDTIRQISGLSNSTTYYWRVRGKSDGGAGAWSDRWSFTTVIAPPATPALVSPASGAADQTVSLRLAWNNVSTVVNYHVQVATDTGFTKLFMQDSTLTDSLKSIIGLLNSTTYYWRVRALNAGGGSAWSDTRTFSTISAASGVPKLVSPVSMSVDQPLSLSFNWNKVSIAVSYGFQIATDTGFTNLLAQDTALTDSLKAINGLFANKTYYWRVRAKSTGGAGAWSNTWSFTTIALPRVLMMVRPADSTVISADTTRLVWNAGESAIDRYMVEVANDAAMTNFVLRDTSVVDTTRLLSALVNKHTYYWRVKAHNAAGWGEYSAKYRLVTSFLGVLSDKAPGVFSFRYSCGTLRYALPRDCFVRIIYYDMRGRMTGSFVGRTQVTGYYTLILPVSTWATGTYIQVFEAGSIVRKDRLTIMR
jgi:hypothetical protein